MLHLYLTSMILFMNQSGHADAYREVSTQMPEVHFADGTRDVQTMVNMCRQQEDLKGHLERLDDGTYAFIVRKCEAK